MENEMIVTLGIAVTSFACGYLLAELQSFRRFIKENCLED